MKVTYKAAAKINLMLDIISRLDNGYHSLFMIMQSVGLYDTVTAERSGTGIEITCDNRAIPCNDSNTAFKAAKLFFDYTGEKDAAVKEQNFERAAQLRDEEKTVTQQLENVREEMRRKTSGITGEVTPEDIAAIVSSIGMLTSTSITSSLLYSKFEVE